MALKKMKENLDRVLDKNLQDLVRGIRNHKDEEAKFISECLDEIKNELKSGDLMAKSNAVNKLLYLQMLGYEISWAAFNIIEVMSSTKFTHKRTGYLVGSQSFHIGTDVLMLATNMIRKDLSSGNLYDAGVALSGLSCFTTPDLAQDLAQDIMSLMTSIRPYLRKKSVLLMYKVYLNYPDALRPSFARLKERLEDQDQGVQSAAVNVICELARKNPKNYLSLAPTFFKLMTTSTNNWMLIKIIKLFGALTPLEPRLGKKLIEPLTNLIHSTSAMSLLYECINTVIAVLVSISSDLPNHSQSVQLCVQKLRVLIEDSDQNLKYLGLLAFSKILKTHPKSVQAHKDLVLSCLDDRDESIRMRALDLLHGMVSKKNLMEIVRKLMVHMEKAEGTFYRDELMSKIIEICSQNNYQHVVNFEWYISILIELTKMKATSHGQVLASQMMDVTIRVSAIRKFAVGQMAILVENAHMFTSNSQKSGICEVLYAAVWICGEFSELLTDPQATLQAMFNSKVTSLPGHVQAVYVQNITKLYSTILVKAELDNKTELIREVGQLLSNKLPMFIQSSDLEVQERACSALQLIKYITKLLDKGVDVGEEVSFLFRGDLNPVAVKAQKKVPVPEGLDLDKWINHAPSKPMDMSKKKSIFKEQTLGEPTVKSRKAKEASEEEIKRQREARLQAQEANPHYLKLGASKKQPLASQPPTELELSVEEIPIENLSLTVELKTTDGLKGLASADKYYRQAQEQQKKKKKEKRKKERGAEGKKRKRDRVESEEPEPIAQHTVSSVVEMPDGAAVDSDDDKEASDQFKALDINLDEPLRDEERLPVRKHRTDAHALPEPVDKFKPSTDSKKKKKKSKDKTEKKGKKSKSREGKVRTESLVEIAGEEPSTSQPNITSPEIKQEQEVKLVNGDTSTKKKKKSDKSKKKSKSKKDKTEYEQPNDSGEVAGSATLDLSSLNLNYVRKVAEDTSIRMEMEPRVSQQHANSVKVQMYFTSLTNKQIRSIEFNMLDTDNSQLNRQSAEEPIKLEFELSANSQQEHEFSFNVADITNPVKLKGTLSYILKDDESSSQQALDFKFELLCRDFLVSQPCTTEKFTQLLTSGELVHKSSRRVQTCDKFTVLLAKICFYGHLYVVESVENSSSLYTSSIQNHHICLLVKKIGDSEVSIDGKAADNTYLNSVLDELSTFI